MTKTKAESAAAPKGFNAELHEWVTSGIFTMTLTKRQIAMLAAAYSNEEGMAECSNGNRGRPSRWISTVKELEARGLMNHLNRLTDLNLLARAEGWLYAGDWFRDQPFNRRYVLTNAGYLICEVLKEAGLIDPELPKAKPFLDPTRPRKPKSAAGKFVANLMPKKESLD